MTRYTVVWLPDVLNDFTSYWIAADRGLRQILTHVANAVDRELAVAPGYRGVELREERGVRILRLPDFDANVAAVFECFPDDRIARVIRLKFSAD